PDGTVIASADNLGSVRTWNAKNGKQLRDVASLDARVYRILFTADGKHLVVSSQAAAKVSLYETATGKLVHSYDVKGFDCQGIAISDDGKRLATCAYDGAIRIFDVASGDLAVTCAQNVPETYCAAFSP